MQWICIIFSFILVIVYSVCCLSVGKLFPTWDKAQWIAEKEGSHSGLTITFRFGNPMTQSFFFLVNSFESSTRQQIQINPVENLKEMLGSSCTKLKLLAESREIYGDWKGTYLGSFHLPVYLHVYRWQELRNSPNICWFTHTKTALLWLNPHEAIAGESKVFFLPQMPTIQ